MPELPEELAAAADLAPRVPPLQANPAIQMVLYEQNIMSGTNIYMRPRRIKIFLPFPEKAGTERKIAFWSSICRALGRHGAADCLLELHLPGACCSYPWEIEIERPWRLRDWRMIETRADEKV